MINPCDFSASCILTKSSAFKLHHELLTAQNIVREQVIGQCGPGLQSNTCGEYFPYAEGFEWC